MEPAVQVHTSGNNVILEIAVEEEEPEWAEGEGWLDSLLPLRDEIARGDLRALYMGWLSSLWLGDVEDDVAEEDDAVEDLREPPVPPGLKQLSPPLRTLVDFLRVDLDLLAAAADLSAGAEERTESIRDQERWLHRLPDSEKNELLLRVMQGEGMEARARLLERFRQETARHEPLAPAGRRTVGELLAAAEEHREARERREQEQATRERQRRGREEAAAREAYLQDLAGRKEAIWLQIESLLEVRRGPEYDQAARYLVDLGEVAQREGAMSDFKARLTELRTRHASKPAFIRRLDAAGLQ